MTQTTSTATAEATKTTHLSQAPVLQAKSENAADTGSGPAQRTISGIGTGSPTAPPSHFRSVLDQMQGSPTIQTSTLLQLQRSYGNSYISGIIQRKCECGGGGPTCTCPERGGASEEPEKPLQRKEDGTASVSPHAVDSAIQSSSGSLLGENTRSWMESRFAQDFSGVRVHTDNSAAEASRTLHAQAFTTGRDIYFGAGRYQPETYEGRRLLAHELTHVVQQHAGLVTLGRARPLIGTRNDPFETQADQVASQMVEEQNFAPEIASAASVPQVQRVSLGQIWEGTKDIASSAGSGIVSVGRTVGGAIVSTGQFVGGVVSTGVKLATGETSLAELIGIPEPLGDGPTVLAIIIRVLQNPVVQALPGYILPPFVLEGLQKALFYAQIVWNMIQNPDVILDMIKGYLQGMVDAVPGKTQEALDRVSSELGENGHKHLEGIWRHLGPKLEGLKNNWWSLLKKMAWEQLWPIPGIWEDMKKSWRHVKALATHAWDTQFSLAIDDYLALSRDINSIAGRLSLWLFLGLVIGYAIAGGVAGAAGGPPGIILGIFAGGGAGAAIAAEIGLAILIATVVVEIATILKSAYNLKYEDDDQKKQECDYERIANSSVTLGIMLALLILGAIAARLAKVVIRSVAKRVWNLPALRGLRDPVTGERIPARGDVIEFRVALSMLLRGMLKGRTVQWLEVIRRNFYVIDLLEEGEVLVTARKGKKAPLYTVRGGRMISVKSTAQVGANALSEIQGWIDELANFQQKRNIVVDNPSGRKLIVAQKEGLSAADVATLKNYGSTRGVQVEIIPDLPPDHPVLVAVDSIPELLADMGLTISDEGELVTVDDCGEEQAVEE